MARVKEQSRVEKQPKELFLAYLKELSDIQIKIIKLNERAERLSEELIPRVKNTLKTKGNGVKTFQRV